MPASRDAFSSGREVAVGLGGRLGELAFGQPQDVVDVLQAGDALLGGVEPLPQRCDVGERPQPLGDRRRQPLALGRGPVARVPRTHELALDVVGIAAGSQLGMAVQAPLELGEPGAGRLERVVAEQPPQLLRGARARQRRLAARARRRGGMVVPAQAGVEVGGIDVARAQRGGDALPQAGELGIELGRAAQPGAEIGRLHPCGRQVALDGVQGAVAVDRLPEGREPLGDRPVARQQSLELAASAGTAPGERPDPGGRGDHDAEADQERHAGNGAGERDRRSRGGEGDERRTGMRPRLRRRGGGLDSGRALAGAAIRLVALQRSPRARGSGRRVAPPARRPRRCRERGPAARRRGRAMRPRSAGSASIGANPASSVSASICRPASRRGSGQALGDVEAAAQLVGAQVVSHRLERVQLDRCGIGVGASDVAAGRGLLDLGSLRGRCVEPRAQGLGLRLGLRQGVRAGPVHPDEPRSVRLQRLDGRDRGCVGARLGEDGLDGVAHRSGIADAIELGLVDAPEPQIDVAIDAVERARQTAGIGAGAVAGGEVGAGGGVAQREPAAVEVPLQAQPPAVVGAELEHRAVARIGPWPVALDRGRLLAGAAAAGGEAEQPRAQSGMRRALARLVGAVHDREAGAEPQLARGQLAEPAHAQALNPHRAPPSGRRGRAVRRGSPRLRRDRPTRAAWRRTAPARIPPARAPPGRRPGRCGRRSQAR